MDIRPCLAATALLLVPLSPVHADCPAWSADGVSRQVATARAAGADCGSRGRFAAAGALRWSATLEPLARQQAAWMAESGELSHRGRGGETLAQRATAAGYRFARIAENVAQGPADADAALASWLASDGHCANLLDPGVSELALACASTRDGEPMWALVLARPLVAAPAPVLPR